MIAAIVIYTTPPLVYSTLDKLQPFGVIRRPLSGNGTSAENANMSLTLDNADGMLTAIFADPPLRLRCEISADDELVFAGSISQVTVSESIILEVQA